MVFVAANPFRAIAVNVNKIEYADETLTRGFGSLGNLRYHFIICRFENVVLSNELIKVELPP